MSGEALSQRRWSVPHSTHGDPNCPGLILPIENGEVADLTCSACGTVLETVPVDDAQSAMDHLVVQADEDRAQCPNCGVINVRPAYSFLYSFVCRSCEMTVVLKSELSWAEIRYVDHKIGVKTGISALCAAIEHGTCIGHGKHEGLSVFCVCSCHRIPDSELPDSLRTLDAEDSEL